MVSANRVSVSESCSISIIRIEVRGGGQKSLLHKSITAMAIAALCDRAAQSSLTPITAIFAGGEGGGGISVHCSLKAINLTYRNSYVG